MAGSETETSECGATRAQLVRSVVYHSTAHWLQLGTRRAQQQRAGICARLVVVVVVVCEPRARPLPTSAVDLEQPRLCVITASQKQQRSWAGRGGLTSAAESIAMNAEAASRCACSPPCSCVSSVRIEYLLRHTVYHSKAHHQFSES
eukprot:COSAG01_NODE_2378_length_7796_cov_5.017020_5_plen_147_part_00